MYKLKISKRFDKQLRKIDKTMRERIALWLKTHLVECEILHLWGKALTGNLDNYWRYRIADFRIIVEIRDKELLVIALEIGHRSKIYE